MRKNIFVALVALCLAVPGMATVSSIAIGFDRYQMENPEMDPLLVQDILRAAADQSEYNYATLQGWYNNGTVWLEKEGNSYQVTDGGGIIIIIFEDSY